MKEKAFYHVKAHREMCKLTNNYGFAYAMRTRKAHKKGQRCRYDRIAFLKSEILEY